jgi:cell division protein FtsB
LVLQRQYAEIREDLTALQTQIHDLDQQLNRPLSDYLTGAGVRS